MSTLPITEYINSFGNLYMPIQTIIPQVRTIEEAQQKKAKEEEREKIVSIISTHRGYIPRDVFFEIQEAITRINN